MACYDCKDCDKHIDNGGLCERFVYDCPFGHLKYNSKEEEVKINEDIKTAIQLKNEIKELIDKYENKFIEKWDYESIMENIKYVHSDLENRTDEKLIEEWNRINKN